MSQLTWYLLVSLFPIGMLALVLRVLRSQLTLSALPLAVLLVLGIASGAGCFFLENELWKLSGLSLVASAETALGAILAMLLFAAPLEEGAKLLVVWSARGLGRLRKREDAVAAAVAVAAGFAGAESVLISLVQDVALDLGPLRALLGACAHVFFAACWGWVLGTRSKLHLLSITWFVAMAFHGLFDHIVFGRDAGTLVVVLPVVAMMAVASWIGLRELARGETWAPRATSAFAPPSLREMRQALLRRRQPLMLSWILAGPFVTTGVVLVFLVVAVAIGREMGVDFSAAEEADTRAHGPLVLLGAAVLAAFPTAGYLVTRASSSHSVLEAAMGSALAIALVVALLSLAAPVVVVFAVAVAPVAFGLACLGAWFGVQR